MPEKYLPVAIQKIVVDTIPDFDLYLNRGGKFVLYKKGNYKFEQVNLDSLKGNNVEALYVAESDLERYESYRRRQGASQPSEELGAPEDEAIALPQGEQRINEIREKFHVLDRQMLKSGLELDFPVFQRDGDRLYPFPGCRRGNSGLWVADEEASRTEYELFIGNEHISRYRTIVENSLRALSRKTLTGGEELNLKAAALRELTKIVVKELLDDPKSSQRMINLKNVINFTVDFILQNENIFYSLMMIRSHDLYTYTHSINVSTLCVGLGSAIGLPLYPDLYILGLGGMLHDIGKQMIDPLLLNKPDRLDRLEYEKIKAHVEQGVKLGREYHELPEEAIRMIAEHHERLDGNGYPGGLRREEISIFGRIVGIVEVYDVMTTDLPYREKFRPFDALDMLNKATDQFDPNLTRELILLLGRQFERSVRT